MSVERCVCVTEGVCVCAGADRELQTVRHLMVNVLQNHTKLDRPARCPPLDPVR